MSTPQDDAAAQRARTQQGAEGQMSQPSEEEMRAAYEAELSRITTADMVLQSAASLLNIGGLRLGLVPDAKVERDLEQVRDAIDAVRGLLPVIERNDPQQLRPLRDALSQLQLAYTRELQTAGAPAAAEPSEAAVQPAGAQPAAGESAMGGKAPSAVAPKQEEDAPRPGPAESSGRLWVPGR
jgi:hypothetical protein